MCGGNKQENVVQLDWSASDEAGQFVELCSAIRSIVAEAMLFEEEWHGRGNRDGESLSSS
ncbi:hypothetical protein Leryth_011428, partial [Lithospermum erythrorhizon]